MTTWYGTKSSFLVPLFTLDDKYIGTIGIDYVTKNRLKTYQRPVGTFSDKSW